MENPMESQAFLVLWIGFLLLMSGGIAALFLWGIRSGQFKDQDRARYLALYSGIPDAVQTDTWLPPPEPHREGDFLSEPEPEGSVAAEQAGPGEKRYGGRRS